MFNKKFSMFISILVLLLILFTTIACFPSLAKSSVKLRLAHGAPLEHPYQYAATYFKDLIEDKSNGRIKISIFPQGELGDARVIGEGIIMGTVDIALICNGPLANWVPDFQVFDVPFLFNDIEHAYSVCDSEIGEEWNKKLLDVGMRCFGYGSCGMSNFTNNRRPIRTPEDMKGLKFRVMETKIWMQTMNALGATAIPLPFPELYMALQQGVADGQSNPPLAARSLKLYEVQDYMSITEHSVIQWCYLMNPEKFDSFSKEDQELIIEAFKETEKYQRERLVKDYVSDIQSCKDNGMEIIEDVDREAFIKITENISELIKDSVPLELVERIRNFEY